MNSRAYLPLEPELFQAWKEHPVTLEMFRLLESRVRRHQQDWVQGAFDASMSAEYVARNSAAKGYCMACQDILNINYDEVVDKHE